MESSSGSSELELLAERIARQAHEGQFRRDGTTPYVKHPEAVASRVESEDAKAVAWLHDVIEDTDVDASSLLDAGVPNPVVEAVTLLTKSPDVPYEDYLKRIQKNPLARYVKIADMLSNLADSPSEKQIVKYAKGLLILHTER